MILGDAIMLGGSGGETASIFVTGLTQSDQVVATKGAKSWNGVWTTRQTPNPAWRGLPSGYTQVEYIQSSGTQYIDTGIVPTANTYCKLTYMMTAHGSSTWDIPFGQRTANAQYLFSCQATTIAGDYGSDSFGEYSYSNLNVKNIWEVKTSGINKIASINDTVYATAPTTQFSGTASYSLVIGGFHNQSTSVETRNTTMKWFGVVLGSDNATMVRDYVPCIRTSDSVIGMYDMVNNVFYDNDGSGTFGYGNEVPQYFTSQGHLISNLNEYGTYTVTATDGTQTATQDVLVDVATEYDIAMSYGRLPAGYTELKCIISTGTQAINTGIFPTNNTRIVLDWKINTFEIWKNIMGCESSNVTTLFALQSGGSSNKMCLLFAYNNIGEFTIDTSRHIYDFNNSKSFYFDSTQITTTTRTLTSQTNYPIYLFANNREGTQTAYNKSSGYGCVVYEDGNKVAEFVPCKNQSNEIGMYDLVNDNFHANVGTGTFTYEELE